MEEFDDEYIAWLNARILSGMYNPTSLPKKLFNAYVDSFIKAIEKGSGINYSTIEYGIMPEDLAKLMKQNVTLFSGAKTFNYVISTEALIKDNGKLISVAEFKQLAAENFDLYNKTWLKTEYETALKQSSNLKDWQEFQANKEDFPLLEYRTVGDLRVSEACRMKNGIVKRVDDPFWKTHSPMTHYGCRCELYPLQLNEKSITGIPKGLPQNDLGFRENIRETGQIFDKSHPYFDIPKGYKKLAKKNFNLEYSEK